MIRSKSSKKQIWQAKKRANRRVFEQLESRRLLADTPIDDPTMNALLAGLDGISGLGDRMSVSGQFAEPIRPFSKADRTILTPGGIAPIGRTVHDDIKNPVRDFFNNQPVADRTSNALVLRLGSEPFVVSVEGGLEDLAVDEIRFAIHLRKEFDQGLVNLEFGSPGRSLGIGTENSVNTNLHVFLDVAFTFGVYLDPNLNFEQAVFVRGLSVNLTLEASAVFDPFTIGVGVLQASVPDVTIDASLLLQVNDIAPNPLHEWLLTDINTLSVDLLTETLIDTNHINAQLDVTASVGDWVISGSPILQLVGDLIGFEPTLTFNADFSEMLLFNRISLDDIVSAQEQLAAWFSSLMNTDLFDVEIPFSQSASIGSVYDLGSAYEGFTRSLRDENGAPSFTSAQAFPYTGNHGINYDPVTNQLSYFILRNLPSQRTESRASQLFVDQVLALESNETAQIDADGKVRLRFILDLTQESQPLVDRTLFSDMRIDAAIAPSHSGATGDAAYGGLGIAYSDATLTGQYTYRADIGDATTNADHLSLNELYTRLSDPTTLLESAIAFAGTSQLVLTGLTVRDGLFVPASNTSIVATVSDILTGIADVVVQNSPDLASFENITFESLAESLTTAILGTEDWASSGDGAVATVGHTVEDFVSVRQQRVVSTINDSIDELRRSTNTSRLLIQDLPGFLDNLSFATASGMVEFTSRLTYQVQQSALDLFFDAQTSVNQVMNFGLGFESLKSYTGGDPLIKGTADFVGARASANAESSATLSIGLELDLSDPNDPVAYVSESTRLTTNVYVGATGLAMDGAVGSVGAQFTGGSIVIAQNLVAPNPAAPAQLVVRVPIGNGRVRLSYFNGFQPTLNSVGRLRADFAVVPDSGAATPERFTFRVGDLSAALTSTVLLSSPSFPKLRDAIDLPNQLQAVPPALDELFAKIELQLENQVFGKNFPLIGKALNGPANFFADLREKLTDAFNTVSSFDVATIETAIETALNNLIGGLGDHVKVKIVSPTEIAFTLSFTGAPINEVLPGVDTDIGLPALGLSLEAELSVIGSYAMSLTFVVSVLDGVYIDTTNESIQVNLDVDMNGVASGRLGFIEVTATASPAPSCPETFHAQFAVGLKSGDGKLKLDELVSGDFIDQSATGLSGCAGMVFAIEATGTNWMPSILSDLTIDWSFDGTDLDGNVPEVTFGKVQLKVGGILADLLTPFLEKIRPIIEPLMPVVDVLTADLPVIDAFGIHKSLLDLAGDFADQLHLPKNDPYRKTIERIQLFVAILEALDKLSDAIADESGTGAVIEIGSLQFGGTRTPQFDARLIDLSETVLASAHTRTDTVQQFLQIDAAPKTGAALYTTPGEFRLPIYENPLNVFKWILGFGQAEIVTYQLPGIHLNIPIDLPIPIIPGVLSAGMFGSIESDIQLFMGIDTFGASLFSKSRNGLDFFQGFYVSDTNNADGSGKDVPEIPITGTALLGITAGTSAGEVGLGVSVGGGIVAKIKVDLIDPDGDGKLRGFELSSAKGCLAIHGGVSVTVETSGVVGPVRVDFPLTSEELGNFNEIVHCGFTDTQANLARLDSATGELVLFVGDKANRRDLEPDVIDEQFTVTKVGNLIKVSAYGGRQTFNAASVISIYANAGSGDDRIIIDASVLKPAILIGGDGDDYLQGGSGGDTISGNAGDDRLLGGNGGDLIVGNDGADEIDGEIGEDTISGGDGNDTLRGGPDNDTILTGEGFNYAYGDDGVDTITGGSQRDAIYGGEGDDTIYGMGGKNVLLGDAGIDHIWGGQDDDVIDGGDDGDFLYGSLGKDSIYGGNGGDVIYGEEDDDYLDGGADGDFLYGQLGKDTIHGGNGDDTLDGGIGDDLLYGEAGKDTIFGRNGIDQIFGGEDADTLNGNDDNDIIHGDGGHDHINGGAGDDLLYGDDGDDDIYGNFRTLNEDRSNPNFTDNDSVYGGKGRDGISGGWGKDTLYGESGIDTIAGNEDADSIDGGDDGDTLYGQDAPDYLRSQTDDVDTIYGGLGPDTIYGGQAGDLIRGGLGADTIYGEQGEDQIFGDDGDDTIDGGPDVDNIDGGRGNDHLLGSAGADMLFGHDGRDTIEGNDGDDLVRGNSGADLLFGDEGKDELRGGTGNDTIRGGNDDDTIYGNEGDDLLLGFSGVDTIFGDEGNDVIYGNNGDDVLHGNLGNDRIYGELGDDLLFGDVGNDVLEGGGGGDILSGDEGDDALYGDEGVDDISGGNGNDFLFAGNGIGDFLRGDAGNDRIVGSDDGSDDPNAKDTTYFGDRIEGGDGDDSIDGLGGSDIINGGTGRDDIHGGTHSDIIIGGPDVIVGLLRDDDEICGGDGDDNIQGGDGDDAIYDGVGINIINGGSGINTIVMGKGPVPQFDMPRGPERRGKWAELSGSANQGGLSHVGGFEEATYATDFGVYVAWVDWRNGNSEIYVAFHKNGVGDWSPLAGFDGNNSASGGGISNDRQQSRRPTLFKPKNSDSLVVAWTSIKEDGTSTIEVAREETNWTRVVNPAQTGFADNAVLVQYSDESGLLAWLDRSTGFQRANVTQFIYEPSCFVGFLVGNEIGGAPPNVDIRQLDIDATEFRAAIVTSYGASLDHDIEVVVNRSTNLLDETGLCPGVPNANVQVLTPTQWRTIHTETAGDTSQPTIGVQLISLTSQGQNEVQLDTDVLVVWESASDHENQIDGIVINIPKSGPISQPSQLVPQYHSDTVPRLQADNVSDTVGYAAKPELGASYYGTYLAWMDDGTFADDGRSSVYILSRYRDTTPGPYVMREFEALDASGRGLSRTGGSLQSLSIALDENGFASTFPYVVWTEAATVSGDPLAKSPIAGVYLRVNQPGLALVDDRSTAGRFRKQETNVLDNDLNLFGEFQGRVTHFDGRELGFLSSAEYFSLLGAKVVAKADGSVSYDPRGVAAFRSLRRGEFLSESFVYRVNNFIYEAEAIVTFIVVGDNRWHNSRNPYDVDDDGSVSPLDVLTLINDINVFGVRELPDNSPIGILLRFLDVDDDGTVSPLDVLLVINWLNTRISGVGEGEFTMISQNGFDGSNRDQSWGEFDNELSYMPIELVWDVAKRTRNRLSGSIL